MWICSRTLWQFYFARYLYTVKLENVIHQQALIALYAFIIHEPGCWLKWSWSSGWKYLQLFLTLKISSLDTTNMTAASHSFVVEIAEFQVLNFNLYFIKLLFRFKFFCLSCYHNFWFRYAQGGDFCVSRGPPTVPLMQILRNKVFSSPKILVRWGPSVCFTNSIHVKSQSYIECFCPLNLKGSSCLLFISWMPESFQAFCLNRAVYN